MQLQGRLQASDTSPASLSRVRYGLIVAQHLAQVQSLSRHASALHSICRQVLVYHMFRMTACGWHVLRCICLAVLGWVFHNHCDVPLASSHDCPPKCTYCQPICAGRRFHMLLKKWPLPASSIPCCHSSIRLPFPIQNLLLTRSAAIITCCCCITLATTNV